MIEKNFQIRLYDDDGAMMIEISKIVSSEVLRVIINFLERMREG